MNYNTRPATTYNNANSPIATTYNNASSPIATTYNNVTSPAALTYNNAGSPTTISSSPKMRVRGRNTTSERELMKLNKRVDLLRRETEKLLASPTPTSKQELQRINKRVNVLRQETDALSTTTRPYRNTTSERELMKLNKRMDLLRRETEKLLRGGSTQTPPSSSDRFRRAARTASAASAFRRTPGATVAATPTVPKRTPPSSSDRFRRAARMASAASAFRRTPGATVAAAPTVPKRTPPSSSDRFRRAARAASAASAFRTRRRQMLPQSKTASAFRSMAKRLQEKRSEYFVNTETDLMHLKNLLFQVLFNMPNLSVAQQKDYVRNLKGLIEPHLKEVGADVQAFRNFDYVTESKTRRFLDIRKDSTGSIALIKFKVSDDVLKNMSEVMLPL